MKATHGPIAENPLWQLVPASADPFEGTAPAGEDCVEGDGYLAELFGEDMVFSVSTDPCPRLTVEQPLLVNIPKGTWIEGRVWHFELEAESPAAGWVALAIEEELVWSQTVPIPAESGLLMIRWRAAQDHYAGQTIQFHVQNHGKNSWHLIDLNAVAGD